MDRQNTEIKVTQTFQEFKTYVDRYKITCLIGYNKIKFSSGQIIDTKNKNILIFPSTTNFEKFQHEIFEHILEEFSDFNTLTVNVYASKTVNKRKYFIYPIPSNCKITNEVKFASFYKCQNHFEPSNTNCEKTTFPPYIRNAFLQFCWQGNHGNFELLEHNKHPE